MRECGRLLRKVLVEVLSAIQDVVNGRSHFRQKRLHKVTGLRDLFNLAHDVVEFHSSTYGLRRAMQHVKRRARAPEPAHQSE